MDKRKVVLITGAAGGIGRETAVKFAREGYAVALSDINAAALQAVSISLQQQHGAETLVLAGDLSDFDYLKSCVARTDDAWGRVDVVVNNAAWRTLESMRSMALEDWERTLRICLTAPAFLSKWAAELMERNGNGGVLINVSSVMSGRPSGVSSAYVAAKGGLESLTKELAVTYGRSGIRAVCVCPGYIDTPLSNDYQATDGENISKRMIDELTGFTPLNRGGRPGEVAEAIFWLSSESASYITGTSLVIDGGFKPNFTPYAIKKLQFPNEF
nr:SDR family oxidoreductase [uncultured Dyadobacter sp.]